LKKLQNNIEQIYYAGKSFLPKKMALLVYEGIVDRRSSCSLEDAEGTTCRFAERRKSEEHSAKSANLFFEFNGSFKKPLCIF